MFKCLWLSLIFSFCAYLGIILGRRYVNRHKNLSEVNKYMLILQNEILYKNTPLPEALKELSFRSEEYFSKILSQVSDDLISGNKYTAYDSFKEIYKEYKEEFYFTKEDEKVIGDFLKVLGESGLYGQEKIFELLKTNIETNLKDALEVSKKNSKLYSYLGVLTGAMIVIFLI